MSYPQFLSVLFSLLFGFDAWGFEVAGLADPSVFVLPDGKIILTGTASHRGGIKIPAFYGNNLAELEKSSPIDIMPDRPSWATSALIWAAEITKVKDKYLLYFVAIDSQSSRRCIGVAKSESVAGPYRPIDDKPLICPAGVKGVIDPAAYLDNGNLFLLYKLNTGGGPRNPNTAIWIAPLDKTGTLVLSGAIPILHADSEWEQGNIESPTLINADGLYYLFYSGNHFDQSGYAIGYATSNNLLGPYVKYSKNPFLQTGDGYFSPGSQGIGRNKCNNWLLVFHAFASSSLKPPRNTFAKKIIIRGEELSVEDFRTNEACP